MDLSGTVGDGWEILANVGGERDHPGSCALKVLPDVQEGHVWTSLARYYRRGCCVVRGGHCCLCNDVRASGSVRSARVCYKRAYVSQTFVFV
jgi:hypothetical protein